MKQSVVLLLVAAWTVPALALGVGGGLWLDSLDISDTKTFLLEFMEDMGVPADELADIEAEMAEAPDYLPVPMPGVFLSFDVGLGALELEASYLSDGLLRAVGVLPPGAIDIGEPGEVEITLDFELAAYRIALGWHPRFDVGFFAAGVGVGGALTGGGLELSLFSPDPEVEEHLPEIPSGTFSWSAGGPMLWVDLELGLPFLRLFGRGNLFLPLLSSTGEAGLRAASWGGAAGLVVRF